MHRDGLPRPDLRGSERAARERPRALGDRAARDARAAPRRPRSASRGSASARPWSRRSGATSPGARCAPLLEREGVLCAGPEAERTPVTVVLPFAGDRAMVTYEPPADVDPDDDRAARAARRRHQRRRSSSSCPTASPATRRSATPRPARLAQHLPPELGRLRALLMNDLEAQRITGMTTPGGRGARAREPRRDRRRQPRRRRRGRGVRRRARHRLRPRRSRPGTRRGRATCSSPRYVAGDLKGLPLAERLQRAVVYAALSVQKATGAMSAATLDELEQALGELNPIVPICPNRHPQRRLHELRKSPEDGIARARGGGGAGRSPASRARAARRPAATRRRRRR